jgi:uncharacterized phage-associated protein
MTSREYDGKQIANFVLDYCDKKGKRVTNLSLQKIVYFCHVWSLIGLGRPLIRHRFEAWEHGPVLQYVYREFKEFGSEPIEGRAKKLDPHTGGDIVANYEFDAQTQELLERVIDFYSRLTAGQLVDLSHTPGGPWEKVWRHSGRVSPGMLISNEGIVEFYSRVQKPFTVQ